MAWHFILDSGVIATLNTQSNHIQHLEDLRGASIAATHIADLPGFQAQWSLLLTHGVNPLLDSPMVYGMHYSTHVPS